MTFVSLVVHKSCEANVAKKCLTDHPVCLCCSSHYSVCTTRLDISPDHRKPHSWWKLCSINRWPREPHHHNRNHGGCFYFFIYFCRVRTHNFKWNTKFCHTEKHHSLNLLPLFIMFFADSQSLAVHSASASSFQRFTAGSNISAQRLLCKRIVSKIV